MPREHYTMYWGEELVFGFDLVRLHALRKQWNRQREQAEDGVVLCDPVSES